MVMPPVTRPNPGDPADSGPTQDTTIVDELADRDDWLDANKAALLHAAQHAAAGADPLTLTQAQITGLVAALAGKATPADIANAISALVSGAPGTLDTLAELATALGNDPNLATTLTTLIGTKATPADITAAINALGLGNAATKNVGTTAGTVAAGDKGMPAVTGADNGKVATVVAGAWAAAAAGGGTGFALLTGSAAPSGGNDGDYYLQNPGAALHFRVLYGPKASGAWPTTAIAVLPKPTANLVTSTGGSGTDSTPVYVGQQTIYAPFNAASNAGDRKAVNVQYSGGNLRLASGPAGISYPLSYSGSTAPLLMLLAVNAKQVTLPTTGTQGVGFANATTGGGVVATCNSVGRLMIEGWGSATVLAQTATGVVAAGDVISMECRGGILTATCYDGTTSAIKGSLSCPMPSGYDSQYASEVGMFWLNNGDGKQNSLKGAY